MEERALSQIDQNTVWKVSPNKFKELFNYGTNEPNL